MSTEDQRRQDLIELTQRVKDGIRSVLNENTNEAARLSNDPDPHTPIIVVTQMAMAQACTEYLTVCGVPLNESVDLTIKKTQQSMEAWIKQLIRMSKPEAKAKRRKK